MSEALSLKIVPLPRMQSHLALSDLGRMIKANFDLHALDPLGDPEPFHAL